MDARHSRSSWMLAMVVLAGSVGVGGVALFAQTREPRDDTRALQVVTFELRQLRQVIEELARSQAQTQALVALVTVQQSRIGQIARNLEAARADVGSAASQGRVIATELSVLVTERDSAVNAPRRSQLDVLISQLTIEQAAVFEREQAGERRVGELLRQLQDEDGRAAAAITRLEAISR